MLLTHLRSHLGGPVAIYRDDLPLDYVAYWLVELNSSHYITISSGPETGMLAVIVLNLTDNKSNVLISWFGFAKFNIQSLRV